MKKVFSVIIVLLVFVIVSVSAGVALRNKSINSKVIKASSPHSVPLAAKARDNTLIVGTGSWNGSFIPVFENTIYDEAASKLIFDNGLMSNDDSGNSKLWMARSFEISSDGKAYTFHINKNIKYSNGDDVTAEDFELTYLAIADPKYDGLRHGAVENLVGYEEYHDGKASSIKGIEIIDDFTIKFTEKTVKASALLQDFIYAPLDHVVYSFKKGQVGSIKSRDGETVGAGPYKLVENKPEQYISFVRNDKYWRGVPKIEKIVMKLTNSTNQIDELMGGRVDIDGTIPCKDENINALKEAGFLNLYIYPSNSYGYIGMNLKNPKFTDKRVRQALMYGLDREGFVKSYYQDYGEVCNAPISQVSWAYTANVEQYKFNINKAKGLLEDAGWKLNKDGFRYRNGEKFTINFMTYTGSSYVKTLIIWLKANYKALGIEVNTELMEFSTLSNKVFQSRDFEMYNMAWGLPIDPDPSAVFSKSQDVVGGGNSVGWVNTTSEELLKAGLLELDQEKRKLIYQKWLKLVNDELPFLFVSQGKKMYVVSSRVKGIDVGIYKDWTENIENLQLIK